VRNHREVIVIQMLKRRKRRTIRNEKLGAGPIDFR